MKKRISAVLWVLMTIIFVASGYSAECEKKEISNEPMTNTRLGQILATLEPGVKGGNGRWQMVREGIPLMVLTDESHNRMRVMAPAAEVKQLNQQVLMRMLEANFMTALDARYGVFNGIVWAVFIHPLDSLKEKDFISAVQQVVRLTQTTGTTYSSSELQFGPSYEEKKE